MVMTMMCTGVAIGASRKHRRHKECIEVRMSRQSRNLEDVCARPAKSRLESPLFPVHYGRHMNCPTWCRGLGGWIARAYGKRQGYSRRSSCP